MTIRKNDPQSEFWKAAEAASRRVDDFPPWKLGVLEPKVRKSTASDAALVAHPGGAVGVAVANTAPSLNTAKSESD